jgi:hypothetical protein
MNGTIFNTKLIYLWGGGGSGKSTLAAQIFAELKVQGKETELIREYIKDWAWRRTPPRSGFDQLYVFAKQVRAESTVFGKVEYAVAECPALLCPIYEKTIFKTQITLPSALAYYGHLRKIGVRVYNFLLERVPGSYSNNGRFGNTEEGVAHIDKQVKKFLDENKIPYVTVGSAFGFRKNKVLSRILSNEKI